MNEQLEANASRPSNLSPTGLLFKSEERASPLILAILLALPFLFVPLKKLIYPTFDPREPPVLRPTVPVVGHIISMIRERSSWHKRLHDECSLPICTLPMLKGKIYIINSAEFITEAMRNPDVSVDPFLVDFSCTIFGVKKKARDLLCCQDGVDGLLNILHTSLRGAALGKLTIPSLSNMMSPFNNLDENSEVNISSVYDWTWGLMGQATMAALYGNHSPISHSDIHWLQEFDRGVAGLSLGFAPWLIAPSAWHARKQLKKLLESFYAANNESFPDLSEIIQKRCSFLRELGFDQEDLAGLELTMPWAGTSNPVHSMFWLFVHVFSNPGFTQRVRAEMQAISTVVDGENGREVTISTKRVNIQCPFLHACFREVLRMYIHNIVHRRVMTDTTIKDSQGHQYLLKKGTDVQWSTSVTHTVESVWGADAASFTPDRFLNVSWRDEKIRRGFNMPFGGRNHLCPGRHLALTENLGFVGVLAVGFDVEGVEVPDSEDPVLGTGARTPVFKSRKCNVRIKRRCGWEDINWRFVE